VFRVGVPSRHGNTLVSSLFAPAITLNAVIVANNEAFFPSETRVDELGQA